MSLETFFTVSEQTMQFLMSCVLGVLIGILYDCFRVIRIIFPYARKTGSVCVSDIIFMLCWGAALFLFSVQFCRSSVRFYCAAGSFLGFVLYILTIGNFVTGIIRAIANAVCKALQKVYSVIFAPIVKLICPKKLNIFVHSYENKKKEKRNLFSLLKNKRKMLYNKKTNNG